MFFRLLMVMLSGLMLVQIGCSSGSKEPAPKAEDKEAAPKPEEKAAPASTELQKDWADAKKQNKTALFQAFIDKYPDSEFVPEAKFYIELFKKASAQNIKKITATIVRVKTVNEKDLVIEIKGPSLVGNLTIPKQRSVTQRISPWDRLLRGPGEIKSGGIVTFYVGVKDAKTSIPLGIRGMKQDYRPSPASQNKKDTW
jgi:hypothetical protein